MFNSVTGVGPTLNMQAWPTPVTFVTSYMIFPALAPVGNVTIPYSFAGHTDSGMWIGAGGHLGFSSNGVAALVVANDAVKISAGVQLRMLPGANQMCGDATLVAGTKAVANTLVTANTRIFLTHKTPGGTMGHLSYTLNAGVGFTINSNNAADTSIVSYMLVEVV